ncbi:MAG: hypothetical protein QGG71_25550, partial [Pirellulaceae bacterium]|nr:hypothetical protein [Pirellulaceae bacterium]
MNSLPDNSGNRNKPAAESEPIVRRQFVHTCEDQCYHSHPHPILQDDLSFAATRRNRSIRT